MFFVVVEGMWKFKTGHLIKTYFVLVCVVVEGA